MWENKFPLLRAPQWEVLCCCSPRHLIHILPRDQSSHLGCWGPAQPSRCGLLVSAALTLAWPLRASLFFLLRHTTLSNSRGNPFPPRSCSWQAIVKCWISKAFWRPRSSDNGSLQNSAVVNSLSLKCFRMKTYVPLQHSWHRRNPGLCVLMLPLF